MKRMSLFLWPFLLMAMFLVHPVVFAEDARAEVVPESYFLVPSSQMLDQTRTALPEPIIQPAAQAAPAESGGILGILNNPAVITLFVSVLVMILKYLEDNKKLESSKWASLVTHLYMGAEQAGLTQKIPGHQKLAMAMAQFDREFHAAFGYPPTPQDRADMQNDLAVHAYDDDTTLNMRMRMLPPPAVPAAA